MFKKKLLNKAIMATVLGGMMLAPSFALALTITGTADDTVLSTGVSKIETGKTTANPKNTGSKTTKYRKYTFNADKGLDGITLNGTNAWLVNDKNKTLTVNGITVGDYVAAISVTSSGDNKGDFNFTSSSSNTSNLTLNASASGTANAYGFYLNEGLGYMPYVTTNINVSGAAGVYGLYADNSTFIGAYGTAVKDFAIGSMNEDTIIYGVSTTATGSDKAAGIYATNNSEVLVPKYTAYVQGNGIVSKSGSKVATGSDKASSATTIYVDNANTNNYAALLADGGQIDINLKDTFSKGTFTFGAVPHTNEVKINGNVVATDSGTVNLALVKDNANSTWEGVAYNNGGAINLWLQNGNTWTNELWGAQTGFGGSHITELTGGAIGTEGVIFQKDSNPLIIDSYSGNTKVFYEHSNDGDEASDYAGAIKITSATAGSAITLITNKTGIGTTNNETVENVLSVLAGKLYYLNCANDSNLAGYVQIAEGLTASSATWKDGNITFDSSSGQGSYESDDFKTDQTTFALSNVITGVVDNDKAYKKAGILREDGKYYLDDTTTITLSGGGDDYRGITNTGNVELVGAGKTLSLNVDGSAQIAYGIYQQNKDGDHESDKTIKIDVGTLKVNLENADRAEAISIRNNDYNNSTTMDIKGDVEIKVVAAKSINDGDTAIMGVHTFSNAFINIDGNLTIKDPDTAEGKWGTSGYGYNGKTIGNMYFGNAAVYVQSGFNACQKSGGVNITGDVDILSQGAALYINGGGGVINVDGGGYIEVSPEVYRDGTGSGMACDTYYYAMRSELGYIYMNVTKDTEGAAKGNVTGAGNKKVNIKGNLGVTCGADNPSLDPYHYESFINLGLNTADSTWLGVAHNAYTNIYNPEKEVNFRGEINLWLANGATWTNELYGRADEHPYGGLKFSEMGSRINQLTAGATAETAGIIFQKDARPITIESYSGNSKVFYEHTNDGDEAEDYAAGDIKITSATTGSAITLITDKKGIDDVTKADGTLNVLASKFYYLGVNNNLTGQVEIAEGLTSSSQSLRLESIIFNATTGQGGYAPPMATQKITGDKTADTAYGAIIKENQSTKGLSGVSKTTFTKYTFTDTDNDSAGVAVTDKDVWLSGAKNLNINLNADSGDVQGISVTGPGEFYDQNTKPVINVETKNGKAQGIYVAGADAGNKTYAQIGGAAIISAKGTDTGIGLYVTGNSSVKTAGLTVNAAEASAGYGYYGASAVYACSDYVLQQGPEVNVAGNLTAKNIKGNVVFAKGGNSKVTVGTGSNAVDISVDSSNTNGYAALRAECGQIDVNMTSGAAGTGKVTMLGNVAVTTGAVDDTDPGTETVINLALNKSGSTWTGVAYNNFEDEGNKTTNKTFTGAINLWLGDSSQWTNEAYGVPTFSDQLTTQTFSGSHVAKLTGGITADKAGVIFQKDSNPLTIDNYSRNVKVFYAHTNDGDAASDYAAGDIKITSANGGAGITLVTDKTDINMSNDTAVEAALMALSGKLYYLGYTTGEDNLAGYVQIAEGLTASSATLKTGNIVFDGTTGKGSYKPDVYKTTQTTFALSNLITGVVENDKAYKVAGILREDGKYHFDQNTVITIDNLLNNGAAVAGANIDLEAGDNTLVVNSSGTGKIYGFDAVGGLTVNAGKLVINHASTTNAYGGLSMSAGKGTTVSVATVNADVEITSKSSGTSSSGYAVGMYVNNGTMNINGKLTMKDGDKPGVVNISGAEPEYYGWIDVYSTKGAVVNLKEVDIISGGEGLYANNGGSVINVDGGSIVHLKNNSKYYALRAAGASINVNMNADKTAPTNNKVVVRGNITTQSDWVNSASDPSKNTVINFGLTTADSSLTGVAYNVFGNEGVSLTPTSGTNKGKTITFNGGINMWLQNGATWNNENWSAGEAMTPTYGGEAFSGSHVAKLVGGSTADKAGVIFQKDSNQLTIDNYSGNTKVFYEHSNDGDEVTDYAAGDIKIKYAASGSAITLITDNSSIDTGNKVLTDKVLNALAGKLYYTAYTTGEDNLSGVVQIAEGLTSASATLVTSDLMFLPTTGQGMVEASASRVAITNDKTTNQEYVDLNILRDDDKYHFDKDFVVDVKDLTGKTNLTSATYGANSLDLELADNTTLFLSASGSGKLFTIDAKNGLLVNGGTNSKLVLNLLSSGNAYGGINMTASDNTKVATINTDVDISVKSSGTGFSGYALGIYASKGTMNINGKLTMKNGENPGVTNISGTEPDYYGWIDVYSTNGAVVNLKEVDIISGGEGLYANNGGSVINVDGGSIVHLKNNSKYYALRAAGANINMNMNGDKTAPANNDVVIKGNITTQSDWVNKNSDNTKDTVINLGLTTSASSLTGVAYNVFGNDGIVNSEKTFRGGINMWLQNGATWNNENWSTGEAMKGTYGGEDFAGSHVAKLVGGSSADNSGIIFQKDANPLTIDNYSGNTKVFYVHNNDGDEATDYAAGDITIKAAATGSTITLITDNTGISDVTKADATLNALAGKLIYSAYVDGEKNLSGKVEIAEGLTASSASLRLEDIAFNETTGRGGYKGIVIDPVDPIHGGDDPEPVEPTVYNGGLFVSEGDNVVINKNVEATCYSDSYFAAGIGMMIGGTGAGAETHLTINGKVTMGTDDEHPGVVAEDKHGAYGSYVGTRWTGAGINMNQGHGSTITITKGLEIYADGHGIVTDPYYCDKKYADKDLAVVTVNGPTTIHVGSDEDVGLYALANYGGTININMKNGQPGTDKVDIFGNALVMKDTMGESGNPYFYRSGEINLALTTADSLWTGAVDNTGTTQVGDFNLYLQNGGTWDYQPASRMDGLSASTMPTPSNGFYGSYDEVSHIANLTGGSDAASRGVIKVNYDDTLAIANYSGNVLVAYEHDEVSPTTIYGGNIKVAKAKVGSVITLFTNNVGVDGGNYTAVLNALAGKLYYTGGDEALIGQVQIGEGLTSQSMTYEGYIAYGANGQGKYTSEKGTIVVDTPIDEKTGEGAFKVEETDDAKTIKMDDKPKMVSVETGSALKNSGDKPLIIDNPQATLVLQSADKTSPVVAATSGNVTIKGAVEVIGVPGQKLIEVGEGKKVVIDGAEMSNAIAGSGDGTVSNPAIDMKDGSSIYIGEYVNSSNEKVFSKRDVQFIGDVQNTRGSFNIALMTDRSYWDGDYQNEDAKFNIDINSHGAKWSGSANGDVINVNLTQGTWVNMGASSSTGNNFTLKGGGAGKAFLDMSNASSGNVTIDNYSGGMTIIYGHEAATPTTIPGGTVRVVNAAQGSVINMMTLNAGVDMSNPDSILDTMDAVANKLFYTNYATEGNIKGTVGIGEGLTRPTMVSHIADYKFDAEPASIDRSTLRDTFAHGEIVYGDTETAMMRGAKMAMASTAMIWRAEANDLTKRMGDLQLRKEEAGVWAKYYSGRQEYNNNGSFSNKYKAVQVGVDKSLGHGWLGGIALSYDAGNGSLSNGGRSDNKVQSLGFYGTKVNKNGEYVDLIGKFSRLENEYTVYNDYGYSLDGDYKNFGMSVSAEYGKHINLKNGLVLTPAVEFTLGRVNSKNYDAYSEYYEKSMTVKQDAFNSAIGRIGVSIGKETATYSYYAKLGLAHEFAGGFDTTYSAPGEPTSGTSINFKDTWKEVQIGGSVKLKNDALLYGSFSKSFGGDVTEKWRIDAGMMFTFNHISDFFGGRKKTEAAAVVAETPTANLVETTAPVEEKNYTAETAAMADANGDRNASVKVGDTEVGATMPASKISKGAFMLDEYVVTASRTKQRITDAKADVSVVTRTEIEAMHMNSVEEVLRTVPGVQFNNYGSGNQMNANISSLRINGSKDVALLVDGVKINDFQGVGEAGNMYAGVLNNMNNIERVEVLRGAAGVLYGSGAKGGVINIITREITENKTIADASIGSFGRKDTKFSTMGKAGKLTYNFSQGTFKQGDVTDGNGDKWEGHTNTHNFGGKVTYSFTDNHKLTLDYMDINSNFGGTDLIYSNFYNGKYEFTMWSIRDDWQINKNWSNTFVYRQNEEKRQHQQQYFAGNVLKNSDTDFKYTFISDQISFHNNRHNLVMGVDYSQGEDQNYTLVNGRNVKREMKNTSFYISEDWTIVPHVTLSGGLRHDRPKEDKYGSKIDSHTTKSYKLAWDVTKKDTVYAGRSEYFILPSMSQLYDKEWGNEGLKPAEGRTESIGYNKKFDDNNFLTVNYFQTKEDCGIGWNGYNRVNTSGISRGWNAQFTSRLSDKWSFNVGWSHLYERSDGDDNYTLGYYPRDLATFGVYYNVGKFDAGLDGYWFFRRKDDSGRREFPADNYGIYNLSMNYKPTKNMKLYCKVENIFNKYYAEHTDAGTDPYLTGTGERKYYAMPGRAFMVGLEFNF